MNNVYILGGMRSYIGVENGIYKNTLPEDLAAEVLKKVICRYELKTSCDTEIDEIICGNIIGTGGNIARLIALKAGIPNEVPAFTVDAQCASSLKAMELAYIKIISGNADVIIVGGVESASMKPTRIYNPKDSRSRCNKGIYNSSQFSPTEYGDDTVFRFGERVVEKYNITEKELNDWSLLSHRRAIKAREDKKLERSIVSVNNSLKDEGIRDKMSLNLLNRLPKTVKGGRSNIGNISLTNDGAAFLILCSNKYMDNYKKERSQKINCKSIFKLKQIKTVGIDPLYSPEGAIKACDKLLNNENISYEEVDAFEFNEAFAAIDVLFERKHKDLVERYNVFGGALAYGHPYGASGAIISLHLLEALRYQNGRYGVAAIAASGGISMGMLVEKCEG